MDYDHLFQTVVCRSSGSGCGEDFHKGVGRGLHYGPVLADSIGGIYLQCLVFRVIYDKTLSIRTVHGCMGEKCQLHAEAVFLTAVRIQCPGF